MFMIGSAHSPERLASMSLQISSPGKDMSKVSAAPKMYIEPATVVPR